jgi:hypothetical protein
MADWKSTAGVVHQFNESGDSIEGELVAVRDGQYMRTNGTKSKIFDIRGNDGKIETVFGSMVLERQMQSVQLGTDVKIVYKGMITTKTGRQAKSFDVFTK